MRFRRAVMQGARELAEGRAPQAPLRPDSYCLRSGSWVADEGVSFEDVMRERFGDVHGRATVRAGA